MVLISSVLAIFVRLGVIALFSLHFGGDIFSEILWFATVAQLSARFLDMGLPSFFRIIATRSFGERIIQTPKFIFIYAIYQFLFSCIVIFGISTIFGRDTFIFVAAAVHASIVALGALYLQLIFARRTVKIISYSLIMPTIVPLFIIGMLIVLDLRPSELEVYFIFASGDIVLTLFFTILALLGRRRVKLSDISRLKKNVKIDFKKYKNFIILAWIVGFLKIASQKSERLLLINILSPSAYIVLSIVLSVRDSMSTVTSNALFKKFNEIVKLGSQNFITFKTNCSMVSMIIFCFIISLLAFVLTNFTYKYLVHMAGLEKYLEFRLLVAVYVSSIFPFLFMQIYSNLTTATMSQKFNLIFQGSNLLIVSGIILVAYNFSLVEYSGVATLFSLLIFGFLVKFQNKLLFF
jgi:O-antigen/teichoic acid export membrane protein